MTARDKIKNNEPIFYYFLAIRYNDFFLTYERAPQLLSVLQQEHRLPLKVYKAAFNAESKSAIKSEQLSTPTESRINVSSIPSIFLCSSGTEA